MIRYELHIVGEDVVEYAIYKYIVSSMAVVKIGKLRTMPLKERERIIALHDKGYPKIELQKRFHIGAGMLNNLLNNRETI